MYMGKFSDEEFHEIITELFEREPACADTLLKVVDKVYRNRIRGWCSTHRDVIGCGYEEDILQDIKIKILTHCTTSFFLKKGVDSGVNTNPEEFAKWMNTVVKNTLTDFLNKQTKHAEVFRPIEEDEGITDPVFDNWENTEELQHILSRAFAVVISADSDAHIVLTWIGSFLFIYEYGIKSCHVSKELVQAFETKTLCQMRDVLLRAAQRLPWLALSEHQLGKLNASLRKPFDHTRTCGEVPYREFFMKSGGRSSISNWNNRMNKLVKRAMKS